MLKHEEQKCQFKKIYWVENNIKTASLYKRHKVLNNADVLMGNCNGKILLESQVRKVTLFVEILKWQ